MSPCLFPSSAGLMEACIRRTALSSRRPLWIDGRTGGGRRYLWVLRYAEPLLTGVGLMEAPANWLEALRRSNDSRLFLRT